MACTIDPLHKWRLNLNNNRYTSLASHACEKNPLSKNMSTRLRMYKVLLFKFRRQLCKGSMCLCWAWKLENFIQIGGVSASPTPSVRLLQPVASPLPSGLQKRRFSLRDKKAKSRFATRQDNRLTVRAWVTF